LPAFDAKVMAQYKDDGRQTPLRKAIAHANAVLQHTNTELKEEFRGKGDDGAIKKQIFADQKKPAVAQLELTDALDQLKAAADSKPKEKSKLWKATYQYVLARVQDRIVYMNEYDYTLGLIRKDSLPPRDQSKYDGWRMAAQQKLMSGTAAKDMRKDAHKILTKLARDGKGTPFEVLARREDVTALGLRWEVTP
jgi:hypothetical protein